MVEPRVATGPMFTDGGIDPARTASAAMSGARPEAGSPCRGCGMVNPAGFLFCGRCGNRLGAPSGPSPAAEPQPGPTAAPSSTLGGFATPGGAVTPVSTSSGTVITARKPGLRASMHLLREDGSEGGTLHLEDGPVPFGRDYGPPFDTDFYLNPRHCAFTVAADGVRVDDLSPINGVYRKIEGSIELQHGDTFRVGQELLYYEDLPEPEVLPDGTERMGSPNPGYWGRVSVLVETGRACEAMPVIGAEFTVGRERGDLTFPTDGYVSSSHCRIVGDDSGVYLEDRGSSNGTYLRVRSGTVVPFGSLVLIGQQLFHVRKA
jgi:pSer/pThr/pTyr-binding forkhead associated (FHA) protein